MSEFKLGSDSVTVSVKASVSASVRAVGRPLVDMTRRPQRQRSQRLRHFLTYAKGYAVGVVVMHGPDSPFLDLRRCVGLATGCG